jgi:hypothetical protein
MLPPKVRHSGPRPAKPRKSRSSAALTLLLAGLFAILWPDLASAQEPEKNTFDIAIIIENRAPPELGPDAGMSDLERAAAQEAVNAAVATAKADVDLLFKTLDRQMDFEHIIRFNRPTIDVICDVFGCPDRIEDVNPFPPLLWQITRREEARLFFYYIGDGRLEGLERQLLFQRRDNAAINDVVGYPVEWLHRMLAQANADSSLVMLDTSFAPRPLPCAGEDPFLINDALVRVRQNYQRIARDHWNRTDSIELSATTPVQPPHCDRFDQILNELEQPLFTKFLLKGIVDGEANADGDDLIELGELARYLDDRLRRSARFQWGRLQNVRSVGTQSHPVAAVQKRDLRPWNEAALERPDPNAEKEESKEEDKEEEPPEEEPKEEEPEPEEPDATPVDPVDPCEQDPNAEGCHPCDIDQMSQACITRCGEDPSFPQCPGLVRGDRAEDTQSEPVSEPDGGIDVVPVEETNPPASEPSPLCEFTASYVAPYLSRLMERIAGEDGPAKVCAWTRNELDAEAEDDGDDLNDIGYLLRPVIWPYVKPYIMPTVKKVVGCALNCGGVTPTTQQSSNRQSVNPVTREQLAQANASEMTLPEWRKLMASLTDDHLFICDKIYIDEVHKPLPFYIGIPRWMPGTLLISEIAREAYGGCPPHRPKTEEKPCIPCELELPELTVASCPKVTLSGGPTFFSYRLTRLLRGWMITKVLEEAEASGINLEQPGRWTRDLVHPNNQICLPEVDPTIVLTTSQTRWLQSALTVDNWNPGPIDGSLGDRTIDALNAWRVVNKRPTRSTVTKNDFKSVMKTFGCRFSQVFPRVEELAKDKEPCRPPKQEQASKT